MAGTSLNTRQAGSASAGPSRHSQAGLDWLNFFVADVQTGFGPFLTTYLATRGWQQGAIGLALTVGTVTQIASQVPGGALVDRVRAKRGLVAYGLLMLAAGSALIGLFPTLLPVLGGEALHGLSSSVLPPAITAIGLGLVGHRAFNERLGRNHRYDALGNALTAAAMGAVGYLMSRRAPFFITVVMCIPAGLALLWIRGDEIDYARARGAAGRRDPKAAKWRELAKNRRLLTLGVCLFLFQFADASVLMLATERLAVHFLHVSELVTSAMIVVPQLIAAAIALRMSRLANSWGRKPLLIAGFAALLIRTVIFSIVTMPWLLVAAQALDGITAASVGVIQPLVVADLTKGTGRYNMALGGIGAANMVGASVSTTAIGFVVQTMSFTAGFASLSGAALAGLGLLWWQVPETSEAALSDE